jgi:hypothetical protein
VEIQTGHSWNPAWGLRLGVSGVLHVLFALAVASPSFLHPRLGTEPISRDDGVAAVKLVAPAQDATTARDKPPGWCPGCLVLPPELTKGATEVGPAETKIKVRFPYKDLKQYLPVVLARYGRQGARVGFGNHETVALVFEPPLWDLVPTPSEGISLDRYYWMTIAEPEKYAFINDIWRAWPETRSLVPYALFPFSFQDAVESLIRSHPGNRCSPFEIAVGVIEFDPQSIAGARVLGVTCTLDDFPRRSR